MILTQPPPTFLLDVTLFTVFFFGTRPLSACVETYQTKRGRNGSWSSMKVLLLSLIHI